MLVESRLAARHAATDVGMVRNGQREGHRLSINEDWRGRRAIVEMGNPDNIRIVGEKHVARLEDVDRKPFEQRGNEFERRAEVCRRMGRDRQRAALHVAQSRRTVGALLDVRRIRAADEACAHFRSRRLERAGDDLDPRLAWPATHCADPALVRRRLPLGSASALKPAGTIVVVSICSMIAGPAMQWPGASEERS